MTGPTYAGTAAAPLLEVEGLTKRFGERAAVDGVSLRLEAGQSLAIVGESGSGKTTTARMITGLEQATSGTVTVGGQPLPRPRTRTAQRLEFARQMQMVFQDPYTSLDPNQHMGDGIAEILALHTPLRGAGLSKRCNELLDQVGLDPRQTASRPRNLSGGQHQRAAIARALAVEPQILVLDEAVAALDVSVQAQIINLLAEIRRQRPISYLFITHDLGIVPTCASASSSCATAGSWRPARPVRCCPTRNTPTPATSSTPSHALAGSPADAPDPHNSHIPEWTCCHDVHPALEFVFEIRAEIAATLYIGQATASGPSSPPSPAERSPALG